MIQAAFWFGLMSLCVKLAGESMPTMQIVFARAIVTLTLSSIGLWRARISPFGDKTGLLLFRGLVGSGGLMCFYAAVVHLPLAEATVIHQMSPVLTALLAALWLREPLQLRVLLGMTLALAGVVLIAQPETLFGGRLHTELPWQFVAVAVAGAFFAALAYVTVRLLGRTEPPLRVVFYFPIVTVPLSAPFALSQWVWPDAGGWALLLGVGATTQIAQIALTKGLAREPAGRAMAVGYLQIAFATLFGAVIFTALPGVWSWLGIGMIVASLFVATRR
jgi:drug/metabolite transporter (DMT)-like permease